MANRKNISDIVIHYTANNGDTTAGNASYFRTEYRRTSTHYFADTSQVVQVVRDKAPPGIMEIYRREELVLMEKHEIPIERVIRHFDVAGKVCPRSFVVFPEQ